MVDDSDKFSRKRWRQAQLLANHYWKRWLREYIPSLQERQKWHKTRRNLQTGELVLIADDNVPRHQWPIGRVTNVFPGSDGLVRSVEVRVNIQKANHQDLFARKIRFWRKLRELKVFETEAIDYELAFNMCVHGGRNVVTFFTECCHLLSNFLFERWGACASHKA